MHFNTTCSIYRASNQGSTLIWSTWGHSLLLSIYPRHPGPAGLCVLFSRVGRGVNWLQLAPPPKSRRLLRSARRPAATAVSWGTPILPPTKDYIRRAAREEAITLWQTSWMQAQRHQLTYPLVKTPDSEWESPILCWYPNPLHGSPFTDFSRFHSLRCHDEYTARFRPRLNVPHRSKCGERTTSNGTPCHSHVPRIHRR